MSEQPAPLSSSVPSARAAIGAFLFLGAAGVGKTKAYQAPAEFLRTEIAMMRIEGQIPDWSAVHGAGLLGLATGGPDMVAPQRGPKAPLPDCGGGWSGVGCALYPAQQRCHI